MVRQPGLVVGPYELVAPLGAGGMGEVWLAHDPRLGRTVAIKFAHEAFSQRFEREARAIAALNHPHIATLYDIGPDYLVMEHVDGQPLKGPMSAADVCKLGRQMAAALAAAHARRIIHRDLKPANILVTPMGVKLLDFGLARQTSPEPDAEGVTIEQTQQGLVSGTPQFMSPEQARGQETGPASDLFSLGAVLYFCLAGQPPFRGASGVDILLRVVQDPPPPLPAEWPSLNAIILRLLEKDPSQRFRSADELAVALDEALTNAAASEARTEWVAPAPAPTARWRSPRVLALLTILIAMLGFAAWRLASPRPYQPSPEAQRWFEEGANALRDGTFIKASQTLERAVALDPKFRLARVRLAEAWSELDSSDKAREAILQAGAIGGRVPDYEALHFEAVQATLTGDFATALDRHQRILALTPASDRPAALVDLGRAHEKAEKPVEAIESYRQAARLSPQFAAAFLRLGVLLARRQEIAAAEEAFTEAANHYQRLGSNEGLIEVHYQRAVMLNRAGQYEEAGRLVDTAIDLARHAQTPHQQIALLLQKSVTAARQGRIEDARSHAGTAIDLARRAQLESLVARGLIDLGNAHFLGRNPAAAEDHYTQALEYARRWKTRRTEARALLSLGSLHIQGGDLDRGVAQVEEALHYYRGSGSRNETIQGLILLGRAARDRGDYAKAEALFKEQFDFATQAELKEPAANALHGLGSLALRRERYPEAATHYRRELETLGTAAPPTQRAYALLGLASAEALLGRGQEARRLQAEALEAVRSLGTAAAIVQQHERQLLHLAITERRPESLDPLLRLAASDDADLATDACLAAGLLRSVQAARVHCPTAAPAAAAETWLELNDPGAAAAAARAALATATSQGLLESAFRASLVLARLAPADPQRRAAARDSWNALRSSFAPEQAHSYSTRPDARRRLQLLQSLSPS
ncbi:MAG: tetratricopeptide repeat protein [Bryobacteraceae bacterium]|nr:tetratricopeptide repeat protein [Bryobacteraceae bacterium]